LPIAVPTSAAYPFEMPAGACRWRGLDPAGDLRLNQLVSTPRIPTPLSVE